METCVCVCVRNCSNDFKYLVISKSMQHNSLTPAGSFIALKTRPKSKPLNLCFSP